MLKFTVTGMSCAACSARVEKAVKAISGVETCSVSLLTNRLTVEGNVSEESVVKAVCDAGYGAAPLTSEGKSKANSDEELLQDKTSPVLRKRLLSSLVFLLILLYFSMGHPLLGFPIPSGLEGNSVALGILQMLLALVVMGINGKFFSSGLKSLLLRAPNMDTLVALGSGASFVYSLAMLFALTGAVASGNSEEASRLAGNFYFETSAMIVTLITVGKWLEALSKGRTTDALKSLIRLSPQTATLVRESGTVVVGIEEVQVGDIFAVKPGESVPVDGVVIEGESAVDESALTGESIPVDKSVGSPVSAATLNRSGYLKCKAVRVGKDTALSQIIQMVSDASETKAPIAKIADKVSGIFVPAVILIALVTFAVWMLCGAEFSFALSHAIAVLVVSCPCALGLATPVAIMVGNGKGARNGILFKTSASLEESGRIQIVALDKTGTITKGTPSVTDILPSEISDVELLRQAASLEKFSEHPLSKAILSCAEERLGEISDSKNSRVIPGRGISATVDGREIFGGNLEFIGSKASIPESVQTNAQALAAEGKTPLFFAEENRFLGVIAVADTLKEESAYAIGELKKLGIHTVMLTGDNERTAQAIARQVGIDEVVAGVLPRGKEEQICRLQKSGKVAMVGDGINDAPALTRADIGMAIGAGTDVAIDAADVVLMKNSLNDVCTAIRLSRKTLRNIHENLFWAFFYNVALMPLAAGAYYSLNGWSMHPILGALAMSLSSFCVVMNALRLNLFKVPKPALETSTKPSSNAHIQTFRVEGMMCAHCEAHVKSALEALPGIEKATANHKKGSVTVEFSTLPPQAEIAAAVEKAGYKFKG